MLEADHRPPNVRLIPNVSQEWLNGVRNMWRSSRGYTENDSPGNSAPEKRIEFERTQARCVTPKHDKKSESSVSSDVRASGGSRRMLRSPTPI